jgi:hypothetical protein
MLYPGHLARSYGQPSRMLIIRVFDLAAALSIAAVEEIAQDREEPSLEVRAALERFLHARKMVSCTRSSASSALCNNEIAKARRCGMKAKISSGNDGSHAGSCCWTVLLFAMQSNVALATNVLAASTVGACAGAFPRAGSLATCFS